jgi:hypothetical protein
MRSIGVNRAVESGESGGRAGKYTVGENENSYVFVGCGKELVEVPEEPNVHVLKWRRIPATCIIVDPPSI